MSGKINGFWELLFLATEDEKRDIIEYMKDGLIEEGYEEDEEI